MSLISPKNFVAPFTNIWHLATIAVIALLFGVYRMAGGGIDIEKIKKPLNSQYLADRDQTNSEYQERNIEPADTKKIFGDSEPETKKNSRSNSRLLDDLIAPDVIEEESSQKQAQVSPLDDIAKQLGAD